MLPTLNTVRVSIKVCNSRETGKKSHYHRRLNYTSQEKTIRRSSVCLILTFCFLKENCLTVGDKSKLYDVIKDIKKYNALHVQAVWGQARYFSHYSAFCQHANLLLHIDVIDGLLEPEEEIANQASASDFPHHILRRYKLAHCHWPWNQVNPPQQSI